MNEALHEDIDEPEDLGRHRDDYYPLRPKEPTGYGDAARAIKSRPMDAPRIPGWSCAVSV